MDGRGGRRGASWSADVDQVRETRRGELLDRRSLKAILCLTRSRWSCCVRGSWWL